MSGQYILIGEITGLLGVAGWVKVHSHTRPSQNIIEYCVWHVVAREDAVASPVPVLESARRHHGGVIAKFENVDDRDAAAALLGCGLAVEKSRFPDLQQGEYYWFQLLGLKVTDTGGRVLGVVKRLLETGANDVLMVEGEGRRHLIPYVDGVYVKTVDLEQGRMQVDWQAEWQV